MRGKTKAITPGVLIALADNPKFTAVFIAITKRVKAAPGVAYPCCNSTEETIKATRYWDRLLCSITKMSPARVKLLKCILDVDNIVIRCKNEGKDELFVL